MGLARTALLHVHVAISAPSFFFMSGISCGPQPAWLVITGMWQNSILRKGRHWRTCLRFCRLSVTGFALVLLLSWESIALHAGPLTSMLLLVCWSAVSLVQLVPVQWGEAEGEWALIRMGWITALAVYASTWVYAPILDGGLATAGLVRPSCNRSARDEVRCTVGATSTALGPAHSGIQTRP